jgi:hypothetical protein
MNIQHHEETRRITAGSKFLRNNEGKWRNGKVEDGHSM